MEAIIEKMQGENGGVSVRTVKAFMRLITVNNSGVFKLIIFLENQKLAVRIYWIRSNIVDIEELRSRRRD